MKKRLSSTAPVVDEVQARPSAAAVADDVEDDIDCDLEGTVGMDDVERVGAKCHLRDSHDSCRAQMRKVPGTVADTFGFATKLFSQKAFADASPSTKLVSVKDTLATAPVETKKAEEQLRSLQKNHDTLESSLLAGFTKAQAPWEEEKKALRKQAKSVKNNFDRFI